MNTWRVLGVGAAVVALAACGPRPPTQQWTADEVIKTFKDEIQTTLEVDPDRSDAVTSVLVDPEDKAGYYSVWVFDRKYDPIDWEIGDVSVPPHGVLSWGAWEALDPESLPGEGTRTVVRTYGNVVLVYSVDQKKRRAASAETPQRVPPGRLGALGSRGVLGRARDGVQQGSENALNDRRGGSAIEERRSPLALPGIRARRASGRA